MQHLLTKNEQQKTKQLDLQMINTLKKSFYKNLGKHKEHSKLAHLTWMKDGFKNILNNVKEEDNISFEINQNKSLNRPLRTDKKDDQEPSIRHSTVHFNNTNQVKTFSSNEKPEEIHYHTNTYGINYKHQRK